MAPNAKTFTLAAGVLGIFVAGVFFGARIIRRDSSDRAGSGANDAAGPPVAAASSTAGRDAPRPPGESTASRADDPADEVILKRIREARMLPAAERTGTLLKALEETTKRPLSRELLEELRSLVKEGEIESSHYVLSLMEQREERASVDFLLEAATHQDPDIADRAMFALEAVAGMVFKDREAAVAWSEKWKPDPERVKLFSPAQTSEEGFETPPRQRGPKGMGADTEESGIPPKSPP